MQKTAAVNMAIFILSLLGLFVSTFLAYEYSLNGPMTCPITGSGCDIVRSSIYANFLGIPIPYLGMAFYLTMAILSVFKSHYQERKLIFKAQFWFALAGVIFGVYLTFLEAFVIKAFCFWCVVSFMISVAILVLASILFKKS
ncbi:vitamin K epoxide reductase family protein [Candidatus Daviesbacteria bacterium]|nr:vitamin K epoxide reductase family protein [Candidatus Daviesbacteria bacterium]